MTDKEMMELKQMRKDMFLTAYTGGTAHLASAFSAAELFYVMYHKGFLNIDPANPLDPDRDRMVLSKGHAGLALYISLADAGFFPKEELSTFIQPGSRIGGEPIMNGLPGVEAATGSLGHGLSIGLGMAMAAKLDGKSFKTYVVVGDGELQEGTNWEAVMAAHKYGLDNLTVLLDRNRIQKMGYIAETMKISDWKSIFESFGWDVVTVEDGHDPEQIEAALKKENTTGEPRCIILETVKGKGVSVMEENPAWHFKMPNKRELKKFMEELDITQEELEACRKHI